jgi:hypothetical protein
MNSVDAAKRLLSYFFHLMAEKAIFLRRVRIFQRGPLARSVARRTTVIRGHGVVEGISREKGNFFAGRKIKKEKKYSQDKGDKTRSAFHHAPLMEKRYIT